MKATESNLRVIRRIIDTLKMTEQEKEALYKQCEQGNQGALFVVFSKQTKSI
jgi:hypothetical protein